MANNPYVNKVQLANGTTLIDITDTTAVASDVASGKYFYDATGAKVEGTASGGGGTTWETIYQGSQYISEDWGNGNYYSMLYDWGETIDLNSVWRVTWDGFQYECTATWVGSPDGNPYAIGNYTYDGGSGGTEFPFFMQTYYSTNYLVIVTAVSGSHTIKIEKQVSSGGSTLITKTITANGTYDAEDDDADGYSSVTVSLPSGTAGTPTATKGTVSNHSISVTPSVTNTAGVISGGTINGTAVTVSASELVSGSETKTANGTYDVTNLATLVVNVSGGSSKNTQTVQSTSRRNNTALGSIISLTCSTAGTYDVYWTCTRSNTSQTWGSQLYIGGSAYGTENTTWSNNVQNNHLENVSISANATVAVYGRSRSGYYIYAPQLTIVQN